MKAKGIIIMQVLTIGIAFSFPSGICKAEEKPTLTDLKDKESYSIGYSFGQLTRNQGVEYDLELLLTGIRDSYGGKDALLGQEEMKAVLKELEKKIYVSLQKQYQDQASKNLKEAEAFLTENSKKEGVVTLPSGLQYKIIKEGSGATPNESDMVKVNYRGTLINGTEFDSSFGRKEREAISVKGVIPGWTEALKLMKTGSKWRIFVPPAMGYGKRAMEKRIPPNSALIFEIELVSIESAAIVSEAETSGAPKATVQK